MSNIDTKILELAKRKYGDNCELAKRTEWSYSFKCGSKSYSRISRFMVEKDFTVSASEMRQRWPAMDEHERMDFASNWWHKENWTDEDIQILEIIMADGDDRIWSCCTQAFLRHPDRNRAMSFLIDRVVSWKEEHAPLNYFRSWEWRRTSVPLRQYFRGMRSIKKKFEERPTSAFPKTCPSGRFHTLLTSVQRVRSLLLPALPNMSKRYDTILIIPESKFAGGLSTRSASKVLLRQSATPSTRRNLSSR